MTGGVRQATIDDVWAVHEIARASWHAAYDDILGPERVDDVVDEWYAIGELKSSIDKASDRDDAAFLVFDAGDDPGSRSHRACRGFASVVPWPEDPSTAYLPQLYVDPDAWDEGVGTALLESLEDDFGQSFDRLRLAVLADNEVGISFYESAAFERVGTRRTDLAEGLEEIVYEKSL